LRHAFVGIRGHFLCGANKEKSNKLEDFLISEMVEKLEQAERSLLVIQLQTMSSC
jgi:hypothetical protein